MELSSVISMRGSYRGEFKPVAVPRDDLQKIVQAGIQAPSGKNEQVTSFIIVDTPELRSKISAILGDTAATRTAQAMIVCITDPRPVFCGMAFPQEDCAACVENMLLTITDLGYASVWTDGILRMNDNAKKVAHLLGVPDDFTVQIILPVGIPEGDVKQAPKKPFSQRAWFNQYGA